MWEHLKLPNFQDAKVLVYGDLMLDRYWYGDTQRISPEAPVPVVRVKEIEARPGGAANVGLNIATLGTAVSVFGLVGEDSEASELRRVMQNHNIHCEFLSISDHPTITKLRVIGQHQQLIRMDFEKSFDSIDSSELMRLYAGQLKNSQVVVLSDYAKGALHQVEKLITLAKEAGVPVLVDPKDKDFKRYAGATVITPNLKEFTAAVGFCINRDEMIGKARALIRAHQIGSILITLGKDGMLLVPQHGDPMHLPTQALEVYDVTGAGDTVIAVVAASLAAGMPLEEAVVLANTAAGIAVSKLGAATVNVVELRRALQRKNDFQLGIMAEAELLMAVKEARERGEKIVMTNGCFDILHAGHVQYLEQSKKLGDRLIVAVNDDASISGLKGHGRPINRLENRMELLSGLRSVDWVVPFSESTPARLITEVLPDILVKGADYQVHQIAGADVVLANGGQVETIALRPGASTSGLIAKIKAQLVMA